MVSLNICGACNGCQHIDLIMKESSFFSGTDEYKLYRVYCSHSAVCKKLIEEMELRPLCQPEESEDHAAVL